MSWWRGLLAAVLLGAVVVVFTDDGPLSQGRGGDRTSSSSGGSEADGGGAAGGDGGGPPEGAEREGMRYVEPTGEEGSGSIDDPHGTLEEGLEAVRAGEVLWVAGGDYEERIDVKVRPGTAQQPIVVRALPGERPVVRGLLWLEKPSYWTIIGINVTWHRDNDADEHMVKLTGGSEWTFAEAELWDAESFASLLVDGDASEFTLRDLFVHDTAEANGTNQDHLIYLNPGTGGGVVEHCLLVGSPNGRAIKVGPADEDGDEVAGIEIRYNTMLDNRGPSNVQLAWDTSDVWIHHNIMVEPAEGRANVTAFQLAGDGNVVEDNIGYGTDLVTQEDVDGLVDRDNRIFDPELEGEEQRPTDRRAIGYGHTAAPGE